MHDKFRTRRHYLVSIGLVGVTGLAGCSSGGDGGSDAGNGDGGPGDSGGNAGSGDGDGDGTEDGSGEGGEEPRDGGAEPSLCADLTAAGYTRYDEPDSPFVGTFEYPAGEDGADSVAATATVNDEHSLTVRKWIGDRQAFDVFPTQYLQGTDSLTAAQRGEPAGLEQVGELSFGDETVPIVRAAGGSNNDETVNLYDEYPYYIVGLPHEGSSGTQYYRFDVRATVQFADRLEPTVCESTWEELARHVVESLEPNPDTAVESAGTD